ncbi:MAG: substrate-binding domain-containing protein [Bacilli bacterium]|nr:substrate-binding domain-containing protein [Bacilli bacterium]
MHKNKFLLALAVIPMALASTSCGSRLKGGVGFMHKQSGNSYGQALWTGLDAYYAEKKPNVVRADKSPSEQSVANQVQMIESLTMMGVKGMVISSSGVTGYDNILKWTVEEKGIKVVSVDSPISPKYRSIHIDHCDPQVVGTFMARSATLIGISQKLKGTAYYTKHKDEVDSFATYEPAEENPTTHEDYHDDPDPSVTDHKNDQLYDKMQKAIKAFGDAGLTDKDRVTFGIISSTSDSPSQNEWTDCFFHELNNDGLDEDKTKHPNFTKVAVFNETTKPLEERIPNMKYGMDDAQTSEQIANTLAGTVDVIVAPTSVAMMATGNALKKIAEKGPASKTKVTGLGMPSEMATYMPDSNNPDPKWPKPIEAICPYMMLWDVVDFGYVAAQALEDSIANTQDWKNPDDPWEYYHMNDSKKKVSKNIVPTLKADGTPDGGYKIIALDPYPFHEGNIAEWKIKL